MPTVQLKLEEAKIKEVLKGVNKLGEEAKDAAMKEIGISAINMLGEASNTLRKNNSIATSNLINSGRVIAKSNHYEVGFHASYASVIEFGRKSGSHIPIQELIPWVKKKLRISDAKEQKKVAFLISRSIFRRGTRAKAFFYPAYEKAIKGLSDKMIKAINKALLK